LAPGVWKLLITLGGPLSRLAISICCCCSGCHWWITNEGIVLKGRPSAMGQRNCGTWCGGSRWWGGNADGWTTANAVTMWPNWQFIVGWMDEGIYRISTNVGI
jgi:hypothetical protein